MGKQSKPRKPESFGKGKVTPIQIAFIVDRYLCDNNFSETRSTFRNEASSLINNSPINEVPKSLLSLGEMLDEYICLKEQKVMVDRERVLVEQEKNRVQMLLQGMQNVMNAYNSSRSLPAPNVPVLTAKSAGVPQPKFINKTPPGTILFPDAPGAESCLLLLYLTFVSKEWLSIQGCLNDVLKLIVILAAFLLGVPTTTAQNTSNIHLLPQCINTNAETGNFSTPMMSVSDRKRKYTKALDATSVAKKSRGRSCSMKIPVQGQNILPQSDIAVNNQVVSQPSSAIQSSSGNCVPSGSQVQGSSVAKCLFSQPSHSIPTNSPVSNTPPRTNTSHTDAYISPPEISSVATCNGEASPTCYTVISTKRVMVSPAKQMAYIESSHCISPVKTDSDKITKRDHVRSRLEFDATDIPKGLDKSLPNEISTSQSDKEVDTLYTDFPELDVLGMDFSFTEMLNDLEIPSDGFDFSYHPSSSHSKDNASGSSHECKANQVISELSTAAEALSEKDMNTQGPDRLSAAKSMTKCKTILSQEVDPFPHFSKWKKLNFSTRRPS
ncbi:uncharacterized protein LOC133283757 [Gastrolobium bilobum]|uniref:uncharacterized protein LOC133283757 n=1 Tax=Gastrolobium bilobum TaxID=150636 RepID=UPI002AB15506|nr:uncharacterized protein LOC133283757 [Gastrolobium bilobum]